MIAPLTSIDSINKLCRPVERRPIDGRRRLAASRVQQPVRHLMACPMPAVRWRNPSCVIGIVWLPKESGDMQVGLDRAKRTDDGSSMVSAPTIPIKALRRIGLRIVEILVRRNKGVSSHSVQYAAYPTIESVHCTVAPQNAKPMAASDGMAGNLLEGVEATISMAAIRTNPAVPKHQSRRPEHRGLLGKIL